MICWLCSAPKPGCKCDQLAADMDALVDGRPVDLGGTYAPEVHSNDEWMTTESATAGSHAHLRGLIDRPPPDERPELMVCDGWQRIAAVLRENPMPPTMVDGQIGRFAGLPVLTRDFLPDERMELDIVGVGVVQLPFTAIDLWVAEPDPHRPIRHAGRPSTHAMGLTLAEPVPRLGPVELLLQVSPGIGAALQQLGETINAITPRISDLAEQFAQAAMGPPELEGLPNEVMIIGGVNHGVSISMPPQALAMVVPTAVQFIGDLHHPGGLASFETEAYPIHTVGDRRFAVPPDWQMVEVGSITTVGREQLARHPDIVEHIQRRLVAAHAAEVAPLVFAGGYPLTDMSMTQVEEPEHNWTVLRTSQAVVVPPSA